MDFLIDISGKINPLQGVMVLSFAIFISSFFVMSERQAVKKFIITLFSVSLILAFYLNIYSFISAGNFSNALLFFENLQMIEISIILFCALNLLFIISTYCRESRHFIKILSLSLFYGATDFKDFNQILQSENISNPLIALGLIIFIAAVYLYLFLFPFQGSYIRFTKRSELSSNALIWFLYFPVGIFMLMKLDGLMGFFIENNNIYTYLLLAIALICITAGSLGAFKTNSLRRIISFLFLFFIGVFILNISMFSAGIITGTLLSWFNIGNIFLIIFSFIPIYSIFSSLEKKTSIDSIDSIRGLGRSNIYLGINLTIIFLSWTGFAYHVGTFIQYFRGTNLLQISVLNLMLLIVTAIAFIFLLINTFRIIIQFFKKPLRGVTEKIVFPRFLYIYVTFFTLVILVAAVWGLLKILNVDLGIINFEIAGF